MTLSAVIAGSKAHQGPLGHQDQILSFPAWCSDVGRPQVSATLLRLAGLPERTPSLPRIAAIRFMRSPGLRGIDAGAITWQCTPAVATWYT